RARSSNVTGPAPRHCRSGPTPCSLRAHTASSRRRACARTEGEPMKSADGSRPGTDEYAKYYGRYIALVPELSGIDALVQQHEEMLPRLREIPESLAGHRYAPGKWSVRE